jgi:peptidoglycan/LPS O-acetylase OafA/YrhL
MEIPNIRNHVKTLDGVRGLAILLVMIYHFTVPYHHVLPDSDSMMVFILFSKMGWIGVDMFFVLSGYLISSILIDTQSQKHYFKNFYTRRFLRIFPLYYLFLFLLIILLPSISDEFDQKTQIIQENQWWFWMYLVNWKIMMLGDFNEFQSGYMWSLAVEEQFYIVWPIIVFFAKDKLFKVCLTLLVFTLLSKFLFYYLGFSATSIYVNTLTHLDGLVVGSIIAAIVRRPAYLIKLKNLLTPLFIFSTIVILILIIRNGTLLFYNAEVVLFGILPSSIIFGVLIVYLIGNKKNGFLHRFFSLRPLRSFGKLCYGLYLFHQPIGLLVNQKLFYEKGFFLDSLLLSALISIMISVSLSYFVAMFSFILFEKPILKLKRFFEYK